MITVIPERDNEKVKEIFNKNGFAYTQTAGVVTAMSGEEMLGYCLYLLDDEKMEILKLFPIDDLLLADGILRSAIHVGCERFVTDIRYAEETDPDIFKKLDFIKDEKTRSLNADKLFGGCHCQSHADDKQ